MEEFLTFNATWPWPWIGPYGIPLTITHQPLPTHQISLESEELSVDRRTEQMDVQTSRPVLLGWLLSRRSPPNQSDGQLCSVNVCLLGELEYLNVVLDEGPACWSFGTACLTETRMKGRSTRGRKRIQLLDDVADGKDYASLKRKAEDRSMWKIRQ